jgi:hypothetical protein
VHREHKVKRGNQQDATNSMFNIKLLSQHVSGIIMPIIRRVRPCPTACGVPHWVCWLWSCGAARNSTSPQPTSLHTQCRTPHAVGLRLTLLLMGIMMPETRWDISLIINIGLVASCWFLSLHPTLLMFYVWPRRQRKHCAWSFLFDAQCTVAYHRGAFG